MTTPEILSCYDSGREAAGFDMDLGEATRAFQLGFKCGRQRPLEIGTSSWRGPMARRASGRLARRRPSVLRRVCSGVAGLLLSERKVW